MTAIGEDTVVVAAGEVEDDVHSCGKCKQSFTDIMAFVEHKKSICPLNTGTTAEPAQKLVFRIKNNEDNQINELVIPDTVDIRRLLIPADKITLPKVENHKCPHCNDVFTRSATLCAHVNRVHSAEKIERSLTCKICHLKLKTAQSLKVHIQTHSEDKPYKCSYEPCTFAFKTRGSLVRHERRHTDVRPFQCSRCHRSFRESGALTRHLKSQTPCTQKLDCELPNYGRKIPLPGDAEVLGDGPVTMKSDLLREQPLEFLILTEDVPGIEEAGVSGIDSGADRPPAEGILGVETGVTDSDDSHLPKGVIEVNAAGDSDMDEDEIVQIPQTITDEEGDQEPIRVHISTKLDNSIEAAVKCSTETGAAIFFRKCLMCQQEYDSVTALKEHLKTYFTTGSYLCELCSYIATTRSDLTAHTTHVHTKDKNTGELTDNEKYVGEEPMVDARCLEDLKTINPLQAVKEATCAMQQLLIVTHGSPDEAVTALKNRIFSLKGIRTCPVCDKTFRAGGNLKFHLRTHTGERPYKCKHCPKDFPTKDTFKKHMLCHSDERSYKCGECGRMFKRISHAKEHLKIHTNDRPFHCELCDKHFKTASTFKCHQKTHTQYLPWVCKLCSRRFREKGSLIRHIRSHTGEKPYQCKYCSKTFSEHGTLARHLKAKIPCTRQLAETRDDQANQADHLITEDHQAAGEVVESDSVLTQFSSVVTDTQEYMSPHSSQHEAAVIPVEHDNRTDERMTTIEIRDETYYIELAIPEHTDESNEVGNADKIYQDNNGHYVLLDSLPDGETLTLTETTSLNEDGNIIYMEQDSQEQS